VGITPGCASSIAGLERERYEVLAQQRRSDSVFDTAGPSVQYTKTPNYSTMLLTVVCESPPRPVTVAPSFPLYFSSSAAIDCFPSTSHFVFLNPHLSLMPRSPDGFRGTKSFYGLAPWGHFDRTCFPCVAPLGIKDLVSPRLVLYIFIPSRVPVGAGG
jgi:hypothetical protein